MTENKDTEPAQRSLKLPYWMVALVLVLLALALFGDKGVMHTLKMSRYKAELESRLAELHRENQRLREEIDALRNDHRRIERIARQELGMVKEDELIYQFPESSSNPQERPASRSSGDGEGSLTEATGGD